MRIALLAIFAFLIVHSSALSQSKTLQYLQEEYDDSFKLALYYSTLKVISSQADDSFYELIKDIEKVFVLRFDDLDRSGKSFLNDINDKILDEGYEELLNMRSGDSWSAFYVKERAGNIKGFFLMIMEDESLNCIDLKGSVPIDKISELVEKADFQSIEKLF